MLVCWYERVATEEIPWRAYRLLACRLCGWRMRSVSAYFGLTCADARAELQERRIFCRNGLLAFNLNRLVHNGPLSESMSNLKQGNSGIRIPLHHFAIPASTAGIPWAASRLCACGFGFATARVERIASALRLSSHRGLSCADARTNVERY